MTVSCLTHPPTVAGTADLLAYWRLDSEELTLKDHVGEANFTGYYQEYVDRPFPSTYFLNELRSFAEVTLTCDNNFAEVTLTCDNNFAEVSLSQPIRAQYYSQVTQIQPMNEVSLLGEIKTPRSLCSAGYQYSMETTNGSRQNILKIPEATGSILVHHMMLKHFPFHHTILKHCPFHHMMLKHCPFCSMKTRLR